MAYPDRLPHIDTLHVSRPEEYNFTPAELKSLHTHLLTLSIDLGLKHKNAIKENNTSILHSFHNYRSAVKMAIILVSQKMARKDHHGTQTKLF